MRKYLNIIKALVEGRAVVIAQNPEKKNTADVMVGKRCSKEFTVCGLVSTLKALAL